MMAGIGVAAAATALTLPTGQVHATNSQLDRASIGDRSQTAPRRPFFLIDLRRRDGSVVGSLAVEKLGGGDSLTKWAGLTGPQWMLFRPGVCFGATPPPSRSVHPYFGGNGELPISYDALHRSGFAVDIVDVNGRTLFCGQHSGAGGFPAHARPARSVGRVRLVNGALSYSNPQVDVKLKPTDGGRMTRITAHTNAGAQTACSRTFATVVAKGLLQAGNGPC
jgi:hypothetical protein